MKSKKYLFTSESVSEGHPDKIADQVSDAILDAYLTLDPNSKVACECLITTGQLIISGEVHSNAVVNPVEVSREVLRNIGYTDEKVGFNYNTAKYLNLLHSQSHEIRKGVVDGGAGDQGLMFGYACTETPELMPLPIQLSHQILKRHSMLRKSGEIDWLLPDAKSQVTVLYENGVPIGIDCIVLSTQHLPSISNNKISQEAISRIIKPILPAQFSGDKINYFINPSGSFTIGGPHGDTGLTGRKIIVDNYGGSCPHGGGAFSGKDPSKVDRSATYAARYVAKHVVASGLASRCTVQVSYAIGVAKPTSIFIDTHGTCKVDESLVLAKINDLFDLTPSGIISTLNLKRPIYRKTAAYGHFGHEGYPWETINKDIVSELQKLI